jgi:hypothetical protein
MPALLLVRSMAFFKKSLILRDLCKYGGTLGSMLQNPLILKGFTQEGHRLGLMRSMAVFKIP